MSKRDSDEVVSRLLGGGDPLTSDGVLLRAIVEAASEAGACHALTSLGLADANARRDVDELRELLVTWRDVKRSAWRTVLGWVVRILLASVIVSLAYRANLTDLLKP